MGGGQLSSSIPAFPPSRQIPPPPRLNSPRGEKCIRHCCVESQGVEMAAGSLIGTTEEGKRGGHGIGQSGVRSKLVGPAVPRRSYTTMGVRTYKRVSFPPSPCSAFCPTKRPLTSFGRFLLCPLMFSPVREETSFPGYKTGGVSGSSLVDRLTQSNPCAVAAPIFPLSPAGRIHWPGRREQKSGEGDRRAEKKEELATLLQGRRPY